MKVQRGRVTLDLFQLTATDYLNLQEGDWVYGEKGERWKVTAVQFSKSNPKSRRIALKHGLHAYDSIRLANGRPSEKLYKERGRTYRHGAAPKAGLVRGARVVAKVPLSWGGKKVPAGMKGTIVEIRHLTPSQSKEYHHGEKAFLSVKWNKGGTFANVYPSQVRRA